MNQERTFKASRSKALLLTVGAVIFVWLAGLMKDARPLIAWTGIIFFGACAVAGIALLITGGARLRVDEDGFEMIGLFNRGNRYSWKELEAIRMAKIRGASVIAIDYKANHPRRSQVSRSLAGMDASIGNIYNAPLKEICAVLSEWHERYGRGAT